MKFPGRFCLASGLFLLSVFCAQAQPAIQIGLNFTGSTYFLNSTAIPPDCNGAIGPGYFVEFINGSFNTYDRTTGDPGPSKSDTVFWSDAGVSLAGTQVTTDPRVIYDPQCQRWFASQVDADGAAPDPTTHVNDFLIAVSDTSDPTGTWHGFKIPSDTTSRGYFADFPTLGLDANGVYLSGDYFHGGQTNVGAALVSIPKADLLAATPTVSNRTSFGVLNNAVRGMVLQPVVCLDGSVNGRILSTINYGNDSIFYSNLVGTVVVGATNTNASLTAPSNITVAPYRVPFNVDMSAPWFAPIQPSGDSISANDARLSAHVYAVSGILFAVHSTLVNGLVAIRWYRINGTNFALLESGTITDPDMDLFFPSIAANAAGTVVIGFNACDSISNNVSCYAMAGQTVNGVTTFGSRILLQEGATSYIGDDAILGLSPVSRWGDYSTITVDPDSPSQFWSIQMLPSDGGSEDVWSTQITQLIVGPQLAIAHASTNVNVSWPLTFPGLQLQFATDLNPPVAWSNVTQNPVTNGNNFVTTLPATNGNRFFRLIK